MYLIFSTIINHDYPLLDSICSNICYKISRFWITFNHAKISRLLPLPLGSILFIRIWVQTLSQRVITIATVLYINSLEIHICRECRNISCNPGKKCGNRDYDPFLKCCREYEECVTIDGTHHQCQLKPTTTSPCTTMPPMTTTTTIWGGSEWIAKDDLPLCSKHEDCDFFKNENCYFSWIFFQKFAKGICINPSAIFGSDWRQKFVLNK